MPSVLKHIFRRKPSTVAPDQPETVSERQGRERLLEKLKEYHQLLKWLETELKASHPNLGPSMEATLLEGRIKYLEAKHATPKAVEKWINGGLEDFPCLRQVVLYSKNNPDVFSLLTRLYEEKKQFFDWIDKDKAFQVNQAITNLQNLDLGPNDPACDEARTAQANTPRHWPSRDTNRNMSLAKSGNYHSPDMTVRQQQRYRKDLGVLRAEMREAASEDGYSATHW